MKQLSLNAKGCSGRGIRYNTLTSQQRSTIKSETAKNLTADSTMAEWTAMQVTQGICAMVLEVTEQSGLMTKDSLLAKDVSWTKYTNDSLEEKLTELFNTKDIDALGKIFLRLHDVTDKEVDDILGEALEVTAD